MIFILKKNTKTKKRTINMINEFNLEKLIELNKKDIL